MDYFVWYDGSAGKTSAEKIQEAIAAYQLRFARAPQLMLVHSAEQTQVGEMVVSAGQTQVGEMVVRAEQTVQPNTFWLGV